MEEACDGTKSSFKPFSTKRRFLVNKIPDQPVFHRTLEIEKAISTFFFVKQGKAKATVTFEKNVYTSNEMAKIHVDLDNRECEKNVNHVKAKLYREIVGIDSKNRTIKRKELLSVAEYEGTKHGESKAIDLELKMT